MAKRFKIYTDHVFGIGVGEPAYRDLTEAMARKMVKALRNRGLDAIYTAQAV